MEEHCTRQKNTRGEEHEAKKHKGGGVQGGETQTRRRTCYGLQVEGKYEHEDICRKGVKQVY